MQIILYSDFSNLSKNIIKKKLLGLITSESILGGKMFTTKWSQLREKGREKVNEKTFIH